MYLIIPIIVKSNGNSIDFSKLELWEKILYISTPIILSILGIYLIRKIIYR